ncbi:MAG TPA: helix-turn-helix transcriptional regulator [Thermoanaerobaculia bacterium]|nr:helix-turn-helix transcriptional regulator [Thermoanaerobaculia bacterium]
MKYRTRDLGSKYFGRTIRKWRLLAGLSQEELARTAEVSATLLGTIERERGHISEEVLSRICLGLESALGKPMLGHVFYEGIEAMWKDLLESEKALREERGWAAVEYEMSNLAEEDLEQAFDSALTEMKKCALLLYRALGFRKRGESWTPASRADVPPESPRLPMEGGKARVRRGGPKLKQRPG